MSPRPRRDGKRPVSARSARARAPRENTLKHPSGIADQGMIERFAARPPDQGKRERITVAPPDHEKRERFTVAPPDHENARDLPRDHQSTKNAGALPWNHQTNAAHNGPHGCINCFLRLRFPFSLWAGFGPGGGIQEGGKLSPRILGY